MLNPVDAEINEKLASACFNNGQSACGESEFRDNSGTVNPPKSLKPYVRGVSSCQGSLAKHSSAGTYRSGGDSSSIYGFRERARCFPTSSWLDLPHESYGRDVDELSLGVRGFLFDSSFRSRPKAGKDYWEGFLDKVHRVNSIGAPRVRVVWWRTLCELGRIPRWPDDREHVLDLEELITIWNNKCDKDGRCDDHFMYVRFISHRWERPHFCENCAAGRCNEQANPDTIDNMKANVLGAWGSERYNDVLDTRPFRPEDAYFWIDFAGISQTDPWEKIAGITALPLYVASCANGMICYVGADGQYADRAWTALERVLGYGMTASPIFMKLDEGYLTGIPTHDRKFLAEFEPQWWELKGDVLHMRFRDPSEGKITVKSDLEHIRKIAGLAAALEPVDFYGVKCKLNFKGGQTVPIDELSRVMHHVVKRKHNNQSVHYPSAPAETEDEEQEFLKVNHDAAGTRRCRCRCPWSSCCRRRKVGKYLSRKPVGALKKDLFGRTSTAKDKIGLVTSRKIHIPGNKAGGIVFGETFSSVGNHKMADKSELVIQTQAEPARGAKQLNLSKSEKKALGKTSDPFDQPKEVRDYDKHGKSWPASRHTGESLTHTDTIKISPC